MSRYLLHGQVNCHSLQLPDTFYQPLTLFKNKHIHTDTHLYVFIYKFIVNGYVKYGLCYILTILCMYLTSQGFLILLTFTVQIVGLILSILVC